MVAGLLKTLKTKRPGKQWQPLERSLLLLRITWRTVTGIAERIVAQGKEKRDPLEGLRRIGIDEISFKKGHRYITFIYTRQMQIGVGLTGK